MARILVLPGIGDICWVMTALQSFIKRNKLGKPEVWIWDFDGRKRSLEYVERIPFVTAGGYWEHPLVQPEFSESYLYHGRSVFPDFQGFDYYIAANGVLRRGGTLQDAFPDDEIDWQFPMLITERERSLAVPGDYLVFCLSNFGMFGHWFKSWSLEDCKDFVRGVQEATGYTIYLTGCMWDDAVNRSIAQDTHAINVCAEPDFDAFMALFRGAKGCFGWSGGNTIKAAYLGLPTMIGWSGYFKDERFYTNACPPSDKYLPIVVERVRPVDAAKRFIAML